MGGTRARGGTKLTYRPGDQVLLVKGAFVDGKLPKAEFPMDGPYTVVKALPEGNYQIRNRHSMRAHDIVYVDRLIPLNERHIRKLDYVAHDKNNGQWPVRAIVGQRVVTSANPMLGYAEGDARVQYRIWWLDWPRTYATWREAEHLVNAAPLIIAFHRRFGYLSGYEPQQLSTVPHTPPVELLPPSSSHRPHFRHHPQRSDEPTLAPSSDLSPPAVCDSFPAGCRVEVQIQSDGPWHSGLVLRSFIHIPKARRYSHLRTRRVKVLFDDHVQHGTVPFLYDIGDTNIRLAVKMPPSVAAPSASPPAPASPISPPSPPAETAPTAPPSNLSNKRRSPRLLELEISK